MSLLDYAESSTSTRTMSPPAGLSLGGGGREQRHPRQQYGSTV